MSGGNQIPPDHTHCGIQLTRKTLNLHQERMAQKYYAQLINDEELKLCRDCYNEKQPGYSPAQLDESYMLVSRPLLLCSTEVPRLKDHQPQHILQGAAIHRTASAINGSYHPVILATYSEDISLPEHARRVDPAHPHTRAVLAGSQTNIMEAHAQWITHGNMILKIRTDSRMEKPRLLLPKMDTRLLDAQDRNPDFNAIADVIYKWETDLHPTPSVGPMHEYWVPQVLDFLFQCRPSAEPWFHGEDDAPYVIVGFYDTPASGSTPVGAQLHAIPSDKFLNETHINPNDVECIHYSTTPNGTWLRMGPMTPAELRDLINQKSRCAPSNENPNYRRIDAASSSRWTMFNFTVKEDSHGNPRNLDWRRYHTQHANVVGEMIQFATTVPMSNERRLQVNQHVNFTWGHKGHKGASSSSVVSAPHGAPSTARTTASTASTPSEVVTHKASPATRNDAPKGSPWGGKGTPVQWGNATAMWPSKGSGKDDRT